MSVLVKKEPWPRFAIKMLVVFGIIWMAGVAFASRYRIGMDTQLVKCIPGYTFFLIDKKDKELKKDKVYVFSARGLQPFYEDGTQMVKFLRGMPGDKVEIKNHGSIYVNQKMVGYGLEHAEALGKEMENFQGGGVLKDDQYWFMGTSNKSFDSRYWGTVKNEQIIGRAYPLF